MEGNDTSENLATAARASEPPSASASSTASAPHTAPVADAANGTPAASATSAASGGVAARDALPAKGLRGGGASEADERTRKARRRFFTVWTAVGCILLAGVVVYLLNVLSGPVGIVIWSVVIVFCLRGPVNWLEKRGVPRGAGTAAAYVLMFAVLGVVGFLMFSPAFGVGDQFTSLLESVPGYAQAIADWGNSLYARYADVLQNETVNEWIQNALDALVAWGSTFARESAAGVVALGAGVVNTLVAIGFALVIAFWILMELPALGRECTRLVSPKYHDDMEMLHVTFTRVMGGYIKGTLLQCAVIGLGCVVLFGVLGIPNSAALGGIAGILNIIPIVGPWLGGALAAVVGVFVSPWAAVVALVGTIAIQQGVYTFVSPKIMSNSVDVHPALTLIALMAGSAVGGAMSGFTGSLVGMLASIPAVAVAKSVFVYYFEKRTGRHLVAEDGVFFQGTLASDGELDPMADATSPHPDVSAAFKRVEQRKSEADQRARHGTRR